MEGREEGDPGFDDWFDEPEPPQGRRTRSVLEDDDAWVLPERGSGRERGRRREPIVIAGREMGTTQLAVVGACFVAIIIAVLAAAGAFSSSGTKPNTHALTTPTTPPPTVSPDVTTPTVPNAAGSAPTQALQPGDTGAQVTALQNALTKLGFSPGKADGDYGPSTQLAVEKFQAANNLAVDGVLGPKTLAALQKALSG
jgi:hypothetical protein